jgi:hypothetical protein
MVALVPAITNKRPGDCRFPADRKGARMGDKGGKKDKEKNKQQQLTKHKQEKQKTQDKAPARTAGKA